MSEVYILVTFVFLAVAAVRLFISLCSKLKKKRRRKNCSFVITPSIGQSYNTPADVDVFVIDVASNSHENFSNSQFYDSYWDEPPPPPYEEAIKLSSPSTTDQIHSRS